MNNLSILPIENLIATLLTQKNTILFDDLKHELERKDDDEKQIYHISMKEDDAAAIFYYSNDNKILSQINDIETNCRSYIIDKVSLKPLGTQYNKIIYNDDALEYIKDINLDNIVIQKCYEGTLLLVYYHNNKWYVSTRRCLDASKSTWIRNKSYYDLFMEVIDNKFTLDDLDKDLCYHFVLIHHKNKNIVNYSYLGDEYKSIFHIMTTRKYTLEEVEYSIKDNEYAVNYETVNNIDELLKNLNDVSKNDESNKLITTEGYVLRVYEGEKFKSRFKILKLQTEIYQRIAKMKPNNSNIHQCFLELYQKDKLNDFTPYFTKFNYEVMKRIHTSMRNMAKEILNIYHNTRNKKNPEMYSLLTGQYKKLLYSLHGIYIENKNDDTSEKTEKIESLDISSENESINIYDVYNYIKSLPQNELKQLYQDRMKLLENQNVTFLNRHCIHSLTQSKLMFDKMNDEEYNKELLDKSKTKFVKTRNPRNNRPNNFNDRFAPSDRIVNRSNTRPVSRFAPNTSSRFTPNASNTSSRFTSNTSSRFAPSTSNRSFN